MELCADDPYSKYTPCVRVIFNVVKRLEGYQNTEEIIQKRLYWLGHLDPSRLNGQGGSFRNPEGKIRDVASERETWYSYMSRALLGGDRHEECIALCEQALNQISEFHYDNDIWFGRRIAEAKSKLGHTEEALKAYKKLVVKKPEWFLYYDIACLTHKLGQDDEALHYAAEAALARSPLHFKTDLFLLLAILLRDGGQHDLAKQHAQLASSTRSEEGWAAKGKRLQLFQEFGVEIEDGPPAKNLARDLKQHWREWRTETLPRHEGEIDWVHHEKPFGFIKADGLNDSVFFQLRSFNGPKERLVGGTHVTFLIKESFDKKKGRMSTQAVEIEPLD